MPRLNKINKALVAALEDVKAQEIQVLDVRSLTTVTDWMIIASGRSDRQVRALADRVLETARELDLPVLGVEGHQQGEWVLVDLGDVIIHIMQPMTRAYYQLEKLWSTEQLKTSRSG